MSSVLEPPSLANEGSHDRLQWLPVVAGLAALYIPTFIRLAGGYWDEEANSHGPIILSVVLWLVWDKRRLLHAPAARLATWEGAGMLGIGLLIYVVGRSQNVVIFEAGSLMPVLTGLLLLLRGWRGVRQMWFPLVFLVFLVPLPGFIVDGITGPLKSQVSQVVEGLLYWTGYPVGRNGVTLTIGTYQLLVADACSGLNSMFSLTAVGMLYLYFLPAASVARNAVVILSILPIAFCANVVRVLALVMITFYLGDRAGNGFLHDFAGMVLFLAALLMLWTVDTLARRMLGVKLQAKRA